MKKYLKFIIITKNYFFSLVLDERSQPQRWDAQFVKEGSANRDDRVRAFGQKRENYGRENVP